MSPVDWVIVNGKIVVRNGSISSLDEPALIHRHQQISDELIAEAESKTGKKLTR